MQRFLWPALIAGSIVFAAGISGTWLNQQMPSQLAPLAWGWFGAALVGLAVFGGVNLAQRGERIGWTVAAVGAAVDVAVNVVFFRQAHGWVLAAALGAFPMLISILAGIVEARAAVAQETSRSAEQQARLDFEQQQAARDAAAERRLREKLALAQVSQPGRDSGTAARPDPDPARVQTIAAWALAHPEASLRDIAAGTGIPKTTASRLLAQAGLRKNGHGWVKGGSHEQGF